MTEAIGIVQNGQIVLEPGHSMPEGTRVVIRPFVEAATTPEAPEESSLGQKLAELGRSMDDRPCHLPSDLAANHDHYLHGLRKRS